MADISSMTLPDGSTYNVKDETARSGSGLIEMTKAQYDVLSSAEKNDGKVRFITDVNPVTPGSSIPEGGSAGQVLKKRSATDYDTAWGTEIAVTGSTIQATETTKDSLPEVIKAVLDSVNPQNWAAAVYRGKFIRNGGGVKTSFTGDYHMMVSSPGGNYASQGIVAAQGSIFNILYGNAVWVVTKQAPANLGITGASVGDLVRISAVSNGKPTAFEKISDPNGNIGIVQNTNTATQNITGRYIQRHQQSRQGRRCPLQT